jgi:hypothetical protein
LPIGPKVRERKPPRQPGGRGIPVSLMAAALLAAAAVVGFLYFGL